jgi:hypothetical protein
MSQAIAQYELLLLHYMEQSRMGFCSTEEVHT